MNIKKKIAQLIIARLDGKDINKKFKYYESLVKKGIGGFIVFGGKLKEATKGIKRLQDSAEIPLFIASDLEQGLGQQIEGGTIFPPAMAIAQAVNPVRKSISNGVNLKNKDDLALLRKSINIIAREAKATGINVILSPVLDVNTNPKNPIICTRAFSDNPEKVAWFGKEFIKGFQKEGIIVCAKHFPGHGDTIKDSHRELPLVKANIRRLYNVELYPFTQAIKAGVKMIMVGHLKVPAIDSTLSSSLSPKIIQELLREKMKFKGLVITDAMNMRAIKYKEEKACLMALKAGTDVILHPSKPEKIIDYLSSRWNEVMPRVEESFQKIIKAKKELSKVHSLRLTPASLPARRTAGGREAGRAVYSIGAKSHWEIARRLTEKSIKVKVLNQVRGDKKGLFGQPYPIILIIDDDNNKSGTPFVNAIKKRYKKIKTFYVDNNSSLSVLKKISKLRTPNSELIIAVFSKISAWKGRSGLSRKLHTILEKAVRASRYSMIVGFCCPYILDRFYPVRNRSLGLLSNGVKADTIINAYSDSELAQEAVGKILCGS